MFDTTRMHLKGQLVAARVLDWDGDLYVVIPRKEAEELQQLLERVDALLAVDTTWPTGTRVILDVGQIDRQGRRQLEGPSSAS